MQCFSSEHQFGSLGLTRAVQCRRRVASRIVLREDRYVRCTHFAVGPPVDGVYPPSVDITPEALKVSMDTQIALGNLAAQPDYKAFVV